MIDALSNLPDRGLFGVVEGLRALQSTTAIYVCCHDTAGDSVTVGNGRQQLHDLYKKASQRNSTAAAAATKRQVRQQVEDKSNKRHRPGAEAAGAAGGSGLEVALAAIAASSKPSSSPAVAVASSKPAVLQQQLQQQQQRPGTAVAPAAAAEPGAVRTIARFSNPSQHAAAAAGTTPLGTSHQVNNRGSSRQALFSAEQLKAKTNKELVDLLKARSCPVSGSKTELIRRLLDYQRRVKKAAQGTVV